MSMVYPFDTLGYARDLEKTGFTAAQAEQQSKLLASVLSQSVAFPRDLETVDRNVTAKIDAASMKIEGRINTIMGEMNVLKWMLGTVITLNMGILLKLFVH